MRGFKGCLLTAITVVWVGRAQASAPLETETARFAPRGSLEVEAGYEFQYSGDGTETAIPLAFEYTMSPRLALLFEPVPYTTINPSGGRGAQGVGDLELTMNGLVLAEARRMPAVSIAAELKVPTAEAPLIGSDYYDATAYLVASKRFGAIDTHANLGYTVVGHPSSIDIQNTVDYAVAAEYNVGQRWALVGEIVGNTAAIPEGASNAESSVTPEISGGETVGMLGVRWAWAPGRMTSAGVTIDNNGALLLRVGLTMLLRPTSAWRH
jgi:hypothetical protein